MRWELAAADSFEIQRLAALLQDVVDPQVAGRSNPIQLEGAFQTLAHLLLRRGISDIGSARRYLNPSIDHLHAPELMTGARAAADRLDAAIDRQEPMLIYGDYDVDGTMAVIILKTAIELCGGSADFHVPHRIREGYDLRDDVIECAAAAGIRLIISVDMGIRAFAPAETARKLGVDLIVTDHHLPGADGIPKALCVVNPNQEGCAYPYKPLCGAGVAFKVAQALMQRRLDAKDHTRMLRSFMKVVAIATIADAVPLTGENRVFARLGLEELRHAVNPGLKALLEVAQISQKRPPNSTEVAFRVAPRINAAGRMDIAREVIELFAAKDVEQARLLAGKLDRLNAERQEEERRIVREVEERIAGDPALAEAYCMVVDGEGWHRGVIGIAATRVVERYHRPAIVISKDGEQAHGSGRSIRSFHLLEAIEASGRLFSRYGGHSHACGFSMRAENIAQLRIELDAFARARLTGADLEPVIEVESELRLNEITPELYRMLGLLEPYGAGNHEPAFVARGVRLLAPPRILKDRHIKLKIKEAGETTDRGHAFSPAYEGESEERREAAIIATPRCHPEAAAIRRSEKARARGFYAETTRPKFSPVFDALGWHMADQLEPTTLVAGDTIDIAFTIGANENQDFGGLELYLQDFKASR